MICIHVNIYWYFYLLVYVFFVVLDLCIKGSRLFSVCDDVRVHITCNKSTLY